MTLIKIWLRFLTAINGKNLNENWKNPRNYKGLSIKIHLKFWLRLLTTFRLKYRLKLPFIVFYGKKIIGVFKKNLPPLLNFRNKYSKIPYDKCTKRCRRVVNSVATSFVELCRRPKIIHTDGLLSGQAFWLQRWQIGIAGFTSWNIPQISSAWFPAAFEIEIWLSSY